MILRREVLFSLAIAFSADGFSSPGSFSSNYDPNNSRASFQPQQSVTPSSSQQSSNQSFEQSLRSMTEENSKAASYPTPPISRDYQVFTAKKGDNDGILKKSTRKPSFISQENLKSMTDEEIIDVTGNPAMVEVVAAEIRRRENAARMSEPFGIAYQPTQVSSGVSTNVTKQDLNKAAAKPIPLRIVDFLDDPFGSLLNPLGTKPWRAYDVSQWSLELAELWNGRVAQLAFVVVFGQELIMGRGIFQLILDADPFSIIALVGSLLAAVCLSAFFALGLGQENNIFLNPEPKFSQSPIKSASEYPVDGYRFNAENQIAIGSSPPKYPQQEEYYDDFGKPQTKKPKAPKLTKASQSASEYPVDGYRFKPDTQSALGLKNDPSPHPEGTFTFDSGVSDKVKSPKAPKLKKNMPSASEYPVPGYRFKPDTQDALSIKDNPSPHPEGSFTFGSGMAQRIKQEGTQSQGPAAAEPPPSSPHPVKSFTFKEDTKSYIGKTERNTSIQMPEKETPTPVEPTSADQNVGQAPARRFSTQSYWDSLSQPQTQEPLSEAATQQPETATPEPSPAATSSPFSTQSYWASLSQPQRQEQASYTIPEPTPAPAPIESPTQRFSTQSYWDYLNQPRQEQEQSENYSVNPASVPEPAPAPAPSSSRFSTQSYWDSLNQPQQQPEPPTDAVPLSNFESTPNRQFSTQSYWDSLNRQQPSSEQSNSAMPETDYGNMDGTPRKAWGMQSYWDSLSQQKQEEEQQINLSTPNTDSSGPEQRPARVQAGSYLNSLNQQGSNPNQW